MGRSRSFLAVLAVPVLTLFIPIFDTTFVMVLRTLAGRSPSQGGRDHTSHRLVALGLSERRAVWMLYGFAILSGLLGLLVRNLTLDMSLATILVFTAALTMVGVHLAGVKVYEESELRAARETPLVAFLVDVSYKRRVVEVLLDLVLIVFSYYLAHVLYYGPIVRPEHRLLFLKVVPVLVALKLATFLATGVYRGFWRYVTIDTLNLYARAVTLGSVVSVLTLVFAFRFEGFSRVILVLDGLILLVLLTGSRLVFRLIRRHLPQSAAGSGRRVLIFGAGDGGELLLRELANNPKLDYAPVGFATTTPTRRAR
jgi:UDP-GlcNAc:undecaprenyl-phosphate GlcNAc-1-phosphate transferase